MARRGSDPKRRIARRGDWEPDVLERLSGEVRYTGGTHHKRAPADYGFDPSVNPGASKSLCDGIRIVELDEAVTLLRERVHHGMVGSYSNGGLPKYIFAVSGDDLVFDTKLNGDRTCHGHELGHGEDVLRQHVTREWKARCPRN